MKNIMFAAAFFGLALSGIANAQTDHNKVGHQHRSTIYQQGSGKVAPETKLTNTSPTAEGKRLPGRDCKLYEGGRRQHASPQYEIGNPYRPECSSIKG